MDRIRANRESGVDVFSGGVHVEATEEVTYSKRDNIRENFVNRVNNN